MGFLQLKKKHFIDILIIICRKLSCLLSSYCPIHTLLSASTYTAVDELRCPLLNRICSDPVVDKSSSGG